MKTLSRLLMLAALATAFALPALAQDAAASPASVCDEQAKNDLYTQYYNLKKTNKPDDQAKAYDITKQYVAKYNDCTDQYTTALKSWKTKYEAALEGAGLRGNFFTAYNAKDIAKTNSLAQQLLAKDPNDAAAALLAGWGTYQGTIAKNPAATNGDALNYINKAISLIESGQEPKDLGGKVSWAPFSSKDEATSYLGFAVASLELRTNTDDARTRLVQLAQGSSKVKEEPSLYGFLAYTYEQQAAQMTENYKTVTKNYTVETDESKLLLANINRVLDQVIDAYARAVAYSKDDTQKKQYLSHLTDLYKSRHNNDAAGLDAYVAGIRNTPFAVTEPITTLPAATPGSGDGAAAVTTGGSTPAASPVANPSAPKPAATTTTTTRTTTTTTSKKPPVSQHN
jgi:hypothetical protein